MVNHRTIAGRGPSAPHAVPRKVPPVPAFGMNRAGAVERRARRLRWGWLRPARTLPGGENGSEAQPPEAPNGPGENYARPCPRQHKLLPDPLDEAARTRGPPTPRGRQRYNLMTNPAQAQRRLPAAREVTALGMRTVTLHRVWAWPRPVKNSMKEGLPRRSAG